MVSAVVAAQPVTEALLRKTRVETLLAREAAFQNLDDWRQEDLSPLIFGCIQEACCSNFKNQGRQTLGYPGQSGPEIVRTLFEIKGIKREQERDGVAIGAPKSPPRSGYASVEDFFEALSWLRFIRTRKAHRDVRILVSFAVGFSGPAIAKQLQTDRTTPNKAKALALLHCADGVRKILRAAC